MEIDFPLVLVSLTLASGFIWLFDVLILSRFRKKAVLEVESQYLAADEKNDEYKSAIEKARKEPAIVDLSKSFFPVLFIVLVLRSFLVEPFQIPSSSMVPSLEVGDFILVNKYAYGIRLPVIGTKVFDIGEPERGDVMVFFPPDDHRYFIKRVIGLPGDKISYVNKEIIINGQVMEQELIAELPPARPLYSRLREDLGTVQHIVQQRIGSADDRHFTVPEGHYFVMGDNRDNSSDSRVWGSVPEANIVGKAFAIWMHWNEFFSIPSFQRAGVIE